jgi:hypothetical protein
MTQPIPTAADERAITPANRRASLIIAALVAALAVAAIYVAKDFPSTGQRTDPGASRFPMIYGVVLLVLCGLLVLDTLKRPVVEAADAPTLAQLRQRIVNVASGMGLTVLGVFAIDYVGYLPATAVYLGAGMWLMGFRHPLWTPLLAVAMTAGLYVAFSIGLAVPLPVGSLFE